MYADKLNLFFALIASALTLYLGVLVFVHDRKGFTNRIFIIHSLVGSVWAIVNYFSISYSGFQALPWIRLVIFFAVPHVFLFFLFVQNFPKEYRTISRKFLISVLSIMSVMMAATLTPVVFRTIEIVSDNTVPVPGPGIPVFSFGLIVFFIWTVVLVFRKYRQTKDEVRKQWWFIGSGLLLAYVLLIFLVFLRVILFNDTRFVPFSPLFILPIFAGAGYAILRHNLFNVKVIAAEMLTFTLLLAGFIQLLFTESTLSLSIAIFGIIFILVVGVILIRSVLKEVRQRQQLQILSDKLKHANEQLKILDRARAEFISMASHQLRTPPTTMKWYLAALKEGDFGKLPEEIRQSIQRLEATNNGLISLIEDMLNVSRIERGTIEFNFRPTDLLAIVQSAVDQLAPMAYEKKLKLTFVRPEDQIPEIPADREKIKQVVNNMIDNAIKYSQTGEVRVNLAMHGENIRCEVQDNGIGMEQAALENIFQKFGRGRDSAKYAAGLGLGLYVAKIVIEQHKGRIWAESRGLGQGSTFIFELPIHAHLEKTATLDLKNKDEEPVLKK